MPCTYKCLRCGHLWESTWIKDVMEELSCPRCESNSQWRISEVKKKKKKKAKKEDDEGE
jgi:hypothetical protein